MKPLILVLAIAFVSICDASLVFIRHSDRMIAVDIAADTTVNDLIDDFCETTPGMNADEAIISYQGQELRDRAALLSDLGICSDSVLELRHVGQLKTTSIILKDGSIDDRQIYYFITVGEPGFMDEIDRQTREALSIDLEKSIMYKFHYVGSGDAIRIPVFSSKPMNFEYDSRCVNKSVVYEMRNLTDVLWLETELVQGQDNELAFRIWIEMPVDLGTFIFDFYSMFPLL